MTKEELRKQLRVARRDHVEALPDSVRALIFHRPPCPLLKVIAQGCTIGLYHAGRFEAPTLAYARFFHELGHPIALPRFAQRNTAMTFAEFTDPYDESDLEPGPFGILQPRAEAEAIVPQALIVPLVGFSVQGDRLGQGGGHYDRWLEKHPQTTAIGLGWDCQEVASLPVEAHDRRLDMIVTPTRILGPLG